MEPKIVVNRKLQHALDVPVLSLCTHGSALIEPNFDAVSVRVLEALDRFGFDFDFGGGRRGLANVAAGERMLVLGFDLDLRGSRGLAAISARQWALRVPRWELQQRPQVMLD